MLNVCSFKGMPSPVYWKQARSVAFPMLTMQMIKEMFPQCNSPNVTSPSKRLTLTSLPYTTWGGGKMGKQKERTEKENKEQEDEDEKE